ncbi:MAG: hypothetical protein AB7V16_07080 [Vulcanibacillus sp.]
MCSCIDVINKTVRETYNDPEASITVGFTIIENKLECIPSTATYRKIKKNSEYETRKQTLSLRLTFCPFCGKKYKDEEENNE